MLRGFYLLLSAVCASLLAPTAAAAQSRPALGWVRLPDAESCISPQALATIVEARVGHRVFVAPAVADLAIEARVERLTSPDAWRAVVRASRHHRPRR